MYEVTIMKSFSAAHILKDVGGKCEDLHGHNFCVEVSVAGPELNQEDILIDFRNLKGWLDDNLALLDHRHLNELPFFASTNPSSERVAQFLFKRLADRIKEEGTPLRVSKVVVWESDNAKVSYQE
ncbi:MAG: 6-carboxytetrahydropterin synthase [Smithellaceae bacterium]|nr:6-carboxytetrahydropterin synthase [Smithellaceae bacterium]